MFFFVGLAVVFGAVFGGFILAGGKLAPIIKSAPHEGFIIVGSAIGAQLIGNSLSIFILFHVESLNFFWIVN